MARGELAGADMAGEDIAGGDMLGADMPGEDMPGGDMPGADVLCRHARWRHGGRRRSGWRHSQVCRARRNPALRWRHGRRWLDAWRPWILHGHSCRRGRKRSNHGEECEFLHRKTLDQSTSPPPKRVAQHRGNSKDRPIRLGAALGIAARLRTAFFTRLETKVCSPPDMSAHCDGSVTLKLLNDQMLGFAFSPQASSPI